VSDRITKPVQTSSCVEAQLPVWPRGSHEMHPYQSLKVPVVMTTLHEFGDTRDLCDFKEKEMHGEHVGRYEYGRYGNPTVRALEGALANLDRGEDAVFLPSGMSAITTTLFALLKEEPDAHIIFGSEGYRRTSQFVREFLRHVQVDTIEMSDFARVREFLRPNTKIVFFELPTNPYLKVVDVEHVVNAVPKDVLVVVDHTFATPINHRPLEWGADLVIPSTSKYISGHNDTLGGAVIGRRDLVEKVRDVRGILGGMPHPLAAYSTLKGIEHLELTMERQNATGLAVARFLEAHPRIERVWYPGLESHPDHNVARRLLSGFGGVVSFEVRGDLDETSRFVDATRPFFHIGPSFGGSESLIEQPSLVSFYEKTTQERLALGIRDNLVRFSVGVMRTEHVLGVLDHALKTS
jgi:cystathionine gamma-synthase